MKHLNPDESVLIEGTIYRCAKCHKRKVQWNTEKSNYSGLSQTRARAIAKEASWGTVNRTAQRHGIARGTVATILEDLSARERNVPAPSALWVYEFKVHGSSVLVFVDPVADTLVDIARIKIAASTKLRSSTDTSRANAIANEKTRALTSVIERWTGAPRSLCCAPWKPYAANFAIWQCDCKIVSQYDVLALLDDACLDYFSAYVQQNISAIDPTAVWRCRGLVEPEFNSPVDELVQELDDSRGKARLHVLYEAAPSDIKHDAAAMHSLYLKHSPMLRKFWPRYVAAVLVGMTDTCAKLIRKDSAFKPWRPHLAAIKEINEIRRTFMSIYQEPDVARAEAAYERWRLRITNAPRFVDAAQTMLKTIYNYRRPVFDRIRFPNLDLDGGTLHAIDSALHGGYRHQSVDALKARMILHFGDAGSSSDPWQIRLERIRSWFCRFSFSWGFGPGEIEFGNPIAAKYWNLDVKNRRPGPIKAGVSAAGAPVAG